MRFTKRLIWAPAGAVLLLAILSGCAGTSSEASAADPVIMRISTGVGPSHHLVKNVFEPWKKQIEEEAGGKVDVEIYNGTTLGSLDSALTDLSNGIYDAGVVVPTYFPDSGLFPLTIAGLAYAYPDLAVGNKVMDKFAEQFKQDIGIDGVRLVDTSVSDTYSIFSTSPIRTVDDLQGKQIKVQGKSDAELVRHWGANPVQISTSETYQALERGTIDAAPYTLVGNAGSNFQEVAPYVTKINAWGTLSTPALSEHFLDSLSPNLRDQFESDFIPSLAKLNDATYGKALPGAEKLLESKIATDGGEIIPLDDATLKEFQDASIPQWDSWQQQADEKGYDGKAMVDAWMRLLENEGASAPRSEGTS